jgi:hypothetical protein
VTSSGHDALHSAHTTALHTSTTVDASHFCSARDQVGLTEGIALCDYCHANTGQRSEDAARDASTQQLTSKA